MMVSIESYSLEDFNNRYLNDLSSFKLDVMESVLYDNELECLEDFIIHRKAVAAGAIVLEDVEYNGTQGNNPENKGKTKLDKKNQNKPITRLEKGIKRIKEFIDQFIKFIKRIAYKFMDKVEELLKINGDWFTKNIYKLQGIKTDFWNNCNITCYPYLYGRDDNLYNNDIFNGEAQFKNYTNTTVVRRLDDGFESDEQMKEFVCNRIHKYDNSDFVKAAKAFYRGSKEIKSYTGTNAKNICNVFEKYAKQYNNTAKKIKSDLDKVTKVIEQMERDFNSDGSVREGFILNTDPAIYSILENLSFYESSLLKDIPLEDSNGRIISVLREETETATNGGVNVKDQKPKSDTAPEDDPNRDSNTERKNAGNKIITTRMRYWRLVSDAETARMTIAEECYNCAIRTLKAVVRNAEANQMIQFRDNVVDDETAKARREAKSKTGADFASASDTGSARG